MHDHHLICILILCIDLNVRFLVIEIEGLNQCLTELQAYVTSFIHPYM